MKKIPLLGLIYLLLFCNISFAQYSNTYPYKDKCPGAEGKTDDWNFYKCECVSYVAWKINELWDKKGMEDPEFCNSYLGEHWGNAGNWAAVAENLGIYVLKDPMIGAVAWWNNHVAFVEKVNDDMSVDVSEYNFEPPYGHEFGIRKNVRANQYIYIDLHHEYCYEQDLLCPEFSVTYSDSNGNNEPGRGGFISPDASSSGSKPNLFVKELRFKDENTEYYSDEDIEVEVKVKNSGKSVNKDIAKIKLKYYRYFGEKENDDAKYIGSDNMKGENLEKGETKGENIEFDAPSTEGKHNVYVIVDTENAVSESNESDNKSGVISCRVHDRPRLKIQSLVLNGGETCFSPGDVVKAEITAKNNGGEPFSDIQVAYYLNNQFLEEDNMRHDNLEHDEEKGEYIYFTVPQTPGTHFISAYIDCYEMVREEDENDNWLDVEFQVADGIPEDPQIPPDPDQGEITIYGECQYFDVIQTYHDNLVDHLIIFNSELKETVNVIGQVAPENFWDNLPIKNGELCFLNWPLTAAPEFSAYIIKGGQKDWLSANLCFEFFNNNPDPNHQHFIIRPGIEPAEEEPLCKYFTLKKIGESGSTVSYQIIFSAYVSGSDIHLIGQCAPDSAWVEYPVSNKTVNVSGWPKGELIHFSVYYYDFQGNKWWLPAEECPECFNGSSDPNDRHFVVYLD